MDTGGRKSFKDIKKLLVNPPVLKAPTPYGLFILESDTSQEGIGGHYYRNKEMNG